jgi:hypothetical protein
MIALNQMQDVVVNFTALSFMPLLRRLRVADRDKDNAVLSILERITTPAETLLTAKGAVGSSWTRTSLGVAVVPVEPTATLDTFVDLENMLRQNDRAARPSPQLCL